MFSWASLVWGFQVRDLKGEWTGQQPLDTQILFYSLPRKLRQDTIGIWRIWGSAESQEQAFLGNAVGAQEGSLESCQHQHIDWLWGRNERMFGGFEALFCFSFSNGALLSRGWHLNGLKWPMSALLFGFGHNTYVPQFPWFWKGLAYFDCLFWWSVQGPFSK